jgi:hypothetical protein
MDTATKKRGFAAMSEEQRKEAQSKGGNATKLANDARKELRDIKTYREIADLLGISHAQVQIIERRAIEKMRRAALSNAIIGWRE